MTRFRTFMTVSCVLIATTLVGTACASGDDGASQAKPTKGTKTVTTAATTTQTATSENEADARPAVDTGGAGGDDRETGTSARRLLMAVSYAGGPSDDEAGVVIGTRAGDCEAVDPDPERAALRAAIEAESPKAANVQLEDRDVLIARCGDGGLRALAKWGSASSNLSLNEFTRTSAGAWSVVTGDQFPGCTTPDDVLKLWRIDNSYCDS